jgi:RND family efflux transporter MFP subunit
MTKITTLILLAVFLCGCKSEEAPPQSIRPVKAIQVNTAADVLGQGFPAVSQEKSEAVMSFRVAGPLIRLNAEEGQRIRKGQLIAEIDPRDFEVDLLAKQARFIQARAEKDRYEELFARGSVAENDRDIKVANFLEAESAYQAAQNALKDTKMYAPYDSFIGIKYVENLEEVKPGQNIISLIDLSVIEVLTHIPENLAVQFFNFDGYSVEFEAYPGNVMNASLKEIGKSPAPEGFPLTLYLDHVNVPGSSSIVAPGMSCRVNIKLKDDAIEVGGDLIVVPVSAVFEHPTENTSSVWILNQDTNTVTKRTVKLGDLTSQNSIQIIEGLNSGEWVVIAGTQRLVEGQEVKLLTI